ncbi:MAG: co-chaperone GroES, partial [Bacteroidaceae bacterium]|nr:co-chaperone GroES [Bacteroidaceae bacterium]
MSIKPLGDRVVATKEAAATKTASGILLGESNAEKSNVATVES